MYVAINSHDLNACSIHMQPCVISLGGYQLDNYGCGYNTTYCMTVKLLMHKMLLNLRTHKLLVSEKFSSHVGYVHVYLRTYHFNFWLIYTMWSISDHMLS